MAEVLEEWLECWGVAEVLGEWLRCWRSGWSVGGVAGTHFFTPNAFLTIIVFLYSIYERSAKTRHFSSFIKMKI